MEQPCDVSILSSVFFPQVCFCYIISPQCFTVWYGLQQSTTTLWGEGLLLHHISLLIIPFPPVPFGLFNNIFEINTDQIITVEVVQTLCFSLKFQLFITCWWGELDLFILDSVAERMAIVVDSTSLSLTSMTTVVRTTSVPCSHFLSTTIINVGK